MAPSPDGDRWRPVQLAVRSTRSLAVMFLLFGGCMAAPMFMNRGPRGTRNVVGLLIYAAPGVIYLVCSIFIARRRLWAIVTTMTIAGIQIALMATGLATLLFSGFTQPGVIAPWFVLIPGLIVVVLILALGQLEYHLARSIKAIRQKQTEDQRGFAPLPVMPVDSLPPPPPEDPDAAASKR